MKNFEMNRRSHLASLFSRLTGATGSLGLIVLLTGAVAVFAPQVFSSDGENGGVGAGGNDRGEDPVVGSLPCIVEPGMNYVLGYDPNQEIFNPPYNLPTVVLAGQNLSAAIASADGEPYGLLNRAGDFSVLGIQKSCSMVLCRFQCGAGGVELAEWLPDTYIGGTIVVTSPWVNRTTTIVDNVLTLPLQAYAATPLLVGQAIVVITPPERNAHEPVRTLVVDLTLAHVILQY